MRHKDVNLCPIGALGLYLLARLNRKRRTRFHREFNLVWCQTTSQARVKRHCMTRYLLFKQSYRSAIKKLCEELGLQSKHFVHIGRIVGTVTGEFNELEALQIKELGNWNPGVMESTYSSKLPFKTLVLRIDLESDGRTSTRERSILCTSRRSYSPRIFDEENICWSGITFAAQNGCQRSTYCCRVFAAVDQIERCNFPSKDF